MTGFLFYLTRRPKIMAVVLIGFAVFWIGFTTLYMPITNASATIAPRPGFIAPAFELPDRQGNIHSLQDYIGAPIIINFWASWCAPCKAEMPTLVKVQQRHPEITLLAINVTSQDDQKAALQFLTQNGITLDILFDTEGYASKAYQVNGLPTTFFLDSNGIIQDYVVGGPLSESEIESHLESIIAGGH